MSHEDKKSFTKHTTISIGLAIAIIAIVITFSVKAGVFAQKMETLEAKNSPSRDEHNALSTQMSKLNDGLGELNKFLRENKVK